MLRLDRFTEGVQAAEVHAEEILDRYGHGRLDSEHFLMALVERPDAAVSRILTGRNVDAAALVERLDRSLRRRRKDRVAARPVAPVYLTWRFKRLIDLAAGEAGWFEDGTISTEHFLLAVLTEQNTPAIRALAASGLVYDRVLEAVIKLRRERPAKRSQPFVKSRVQIAAHKQAARDQAGQFTKTAREIARRKRIGKAAPLDRFTTSARQTAQRAVLIARHYGHDEVDTEHVLLALVEQPDDGTSAILQRLRFDPARLAARLEQILPKKWKVNLFGREDSEIRLAPRLQGAIDCSSDEADQLEDREIDNEHLLLAILKDADSPAGRILASAGLTHGQVLNTIMELRKEKTYDAI